MSAPRGRAYLALADGTIYEGEAFGAAATGAGEDGPAVDVDLVALGSLFASFARRRWTNGARSWPAEN